MIVKEHAEEIHASTLDVHLMPDSHDPFFTCLTFRDRLKRAPVFFEGCLELPSPPDEQALFAAIFNDEKPASARRMSTSGELKKAYDEVLGHIREEDGEHLHLHLRINNNVLDLHSTFWEWMQEEEGKEPLAVSPVTPFARALHTSKAAPDTLTLAAGEKLRLLLVRSSPSKPYPVAGGALDHIPAVELTTLRNTLAALELPVEITMLGDKEDSFISLETIRKTLVSARDMGKPFQLLYLLCHGITEKNQGVLLLGDSLKSETDIQENLADLPLRAIVLASCWTAEVVSGDALKGVGRSLVDAGIPAVVAMQEALEYRAASIFAQRFFADLIQHGQADVAANAARRELWIKRQKKAVAEKEEIGPHQWGAPVLFLRYQNGPLWQWAKDAAPPPLASRDIQVPDYPAEAGTEVAQQFLERSFSHLPFQTEALVQALRDVVQERRREPEGGEIPDCWKPEKVNFLIDKNQNDYLKELKERINLKFGTAPVIEQALAALQAGKHIIFCGPPGTGKTMLANKLSNYAKQQGYCKGHLTVTATADWTTSDTIGGYMPDRNHQLFYRPGLIPRAIKEGKWVVLDEINRADIDKAFGELFTLLSGQGITLPYTVRELPVRIRPATNNKDKDNLEDIGCDYVVNEHWRILGTMNIFDKASLYSMSLAFQRRFAFIHVPLPEDAVYKTLLEKYVAYLGFTEAELAAVHKLFLEKDDNNTITPLRAYRGLGPAIAEDLVDYLKVRGKEYLHEAIALYVVPQLEGLDDDAIEKIYQYLYSNVLIKCADMEKDFVCERIKEMYPFKTEWTRK